MEKTSFEALITQNSVLSIVALKREDSLTYTVWIRLMQQKECNRLQWLIKWWTEPAVRWLVRICPNYGDYIDWAKFNCSQDRSQYLMWYNFEAVIWTLFASYFLLLLKKNVDFMFSFPKKAAFGHTYSFVPSGHFFRPGQLCISVLKLLWWITVVFWQFLNSYHCAFLTFWTAGNVIAGQPEHHFRNCFCDFFRQVRIWIN